MRILVRTLNIPGRTVGEKSKIWGTVSVIMKSLRARSIVIKLLSNDCTVLQIKPKMNSVCNYTEKPGVRVDRGGVKHTCY